MKNKEKSKIYNDIANLKIEINEDISKGKFKKSFYEFIFVLHGKIGININGNNKILNSKSGILILPNIPYIIDKADMDSVKIKYLKLPVPVSFMENEFSECSDFKNSVKALKTFKVSGGECSQAFSMAERIHSQPITEKRNYLYIKLIHRLCADMLEGTGERRSRKIKWFSALISEIDNMPAIEIDYEILFKKSGVSAKTLWQNFKKFYGITPSEYIRNKKCKAAYDLIMDGGASVSDIANRIGYGSYAQFYRDFMATFKISPGKVKTQSKQNFCK